MLQVAVLLPAGGGVDQDPVAVEAGPDRSDLRGAVRVDRRDAPVVHGFECVANFTGERGH
jgi:hypothetical protein